MSPTTHRVEIVAALFAILGLALAACGSLAGDADVAPVLVPVTTQVIAPEPIVEPALEPAATQQLAPLSFEAATYRNEAAGFEFDYPAAWVPDQQVFGPRGSGVQFMPSEDTWLTVMVTLWDPKNDLDAFVEQRRTGWSSSQATILSEEELTLAGGRRAVSFVVEGVDGIEAFYMFTTLGEDYLLLSGAGDHDLLAEIARTIRQYPE
jgi:hypothetical protein